MNIFNLIVKSIWNKKLLSILIIIQITITMLVVLESLIGLEMPNYKEKELKTELKIDFDTTYLLSIYSTQIGFDQVHEFLTLKEEVKNISYLKDIGEYAYHSFICNEIDTNKHYQDIRKSVIGNTIYGQPPDINETDTLLLSNNIYELLNPKIVEGRGLVKTDFEVKENGIVPVLVPAGLKGIVSLNQVLTFDASIYQNTYKVVGFYADNSKWMAPNDIEYSSLRNLSSSIVAPFSYIELTSPLPVMSRLNGIYFSVNSKSDGLKAKQDIEKLGQKHGMNVECKSINMIFDKYRKDNAKFIFQYIFFGIFMIIASCFGLAANMIYTIFCRKKEFGIRITAGASKLYIQAIVIGEMAFLTIVAALIAIISKLISIQDATKEALYFQSNIPRLTFYDFSMSILITILIIFVASVIPITKINSLQPKELIGGID